MRDDNATKNPSQTIEDQRKMFNEIKEHTRAAVSLVNTGKEFACYLCGDRIQEYETLVGIIEEGELAGDVHPVEMRSTDTPNAGFYPLCNECEFEFNQRADSKRSDLVYKWLHNKLVVDEAAWEAAWNAGREAGLIEGAGRYAELKITDDGTSPDVLPVLRDAQKGHETAGKLLHPEVIGLAPKITKTRTASVVVEKEEARAVTE